MYDSKPSQFTIPVKKDFAHSESCPPPALSRPHVCTQICHSHAIPPRQFTFNFFTKIPPSDSTTPLNAYK